MAKAFYIGSYESGLINAVKPFSLPENSFSKMENAYVWRGRVKKRVGSHLLGGADFDSQYKHLASRLRIEVDATDQGGDAAGACPGAVVGSDCIGQMFSIGNEIFTVYQATGAPADMLKTGAATTYTHDSSNRAYAFIGAAASTPIYWYPAQPVMGIVNYEISSISVERTYAFDRQFAYKRSGGGWDRLGIAGGPGIWTGSDNQFFWTANYRGTTNDDYYLFVVNNNRADSIKYWDGAVWLPLTPQTRLNNPSAGGLATNFVLDSARLCVSFKDRLIVLNTLETVDTGTGATPAEFVNRARWCQNGSPVAAEAWYDDVAGRGGWLDAPTRESIITAQILKDRLVVYFEKSTWELVYTGNHLVPFVWQVIDDQLGAESTFSSVLFDKVVFGIGQSGIHQCDGMRVQRIDEKIPDKIFKIHNENGGVERVAGIRDKLTEMVYWTFPKAASNGTFPNRMLVYNYKNGSWSFNDDSITAFGYHQNADDLTWGACHYTWEEFGRMWNSGLNQSLTKNVLAGNQQGFTFIMDSSRFRNAPALQITAIDLAALPLVNITAINHNLQNGDFILIEYVQGTTNLNGVIFKVIVTSNDTFSIDEQDNLPPAGDYTGGGLISRVSKIDIRTKQFNFYKEGMRMAIDKVDFDVDRSAYGNINVNFFSSTSKANMRLQAMLNNVNLGNYILDTFPYAIYPQENDQKRLTRPVYIQAEGDCIQLQLTWDDEQMLDARNMKSAFELNSMTFYVSPTGRRL